MSTVCKIHIDSEDEPTIQSLLISHLETEFAEEEVRVSKTEWPSATEADSFIPSDDTPSMFSLKSDGGLTEVYFNTFSTNENLAKLLSKELSTVVSVCIYQSTAEAGSWIFCRDGEKLRSIEFGDGEVQEEDGDRLLFENDPLGHDIGEEGSPFYCFDSEDLDFYNESVGINIPMYNEPKPNWVNIEVKRIIPEKPAQTRAVKKPWWKIW